MSAHDGVESRQIDDLFEGTDNRSGTDRRRGGDRRVQSLDFKGPDRRQGERRSGIDRRQRRAARRRRI